MLFSPKTVAKLRGRPMGCLKLLRVGHTNTTEKQTDGQNLAYNINTSSGFHLLNIVLFGF